MVCSPAVSALGSLFVLGAVIWVDRRLPHLMMASGTLLLAVGVALVTVAGGFVLAGFRMFLSGIGGAFTGSLIFYSVAVKGCVRFRGTLLGALALAFSIGLPDLAVALGWGDWASSDQLTSQATLLWPVGLVLAAGVLLFLLLPRWFRGVYGPGPSLRETLVVHRARLDLAWVAGVYLVAAIILAAGTTHLRWVALATARDFGEPDFSLAAFTLAAGIGALLWGIASDFFPVRRLLIFLAVLSLPAAAWGWLLDDPEGGALLLSLVRGRADQPAVGPDGGGPARTALRQAGPGRHLRRLVRQWPRTNLLGFCPGPLGGRCVFLDSPC